MSDPWWANYVLAVIVATLVVFAAVLFLRRRIRREDREHRQQQSQGACQGLPQSEARGQVPERAQVVLGARNDNFLTAWDRSWRLPVADNSAVTFRYTQLADRPTGLVVGLQSAATTADDWAHSGSGYAVVLDNAGAGTASRSWVAHLPLVNREMMASRIAQHFHLCSGATYWVAVAFGVLAFGEGDRPGEHTVLCTRDPAGPGAHIAPIRYVGFGTWDFTLGSSASGNAYGHARIDAIRLLGPLPQGTLVPSPITFARYHAVVASA